MLSQARVLVADDDPELLRAVSEVLERSGAEVVRAASGAELEIERMADEGPFTLVVTDISMPWMNGLQAMHSARHAGLGTPILVMTALDDERITDQVGALGRNAVLLRKPFDSSELTSAAEELLSASPSSAGSTAEASAGGTSVEPRIAQIFAGMDAGCLATAFDLLADGVLLVDTEGTVVIANLAARALFDGALDDGKPMKIELRRPSGERLQVSDLSVAGTDKDTRVDAEEFVIGRADGTFLPAVVSAVPVRAEGRAAGAFMVLRSSLVERGRDGAAREEWALLLAHDLRQPINAIVLTSDLLLQNATGEDQREQLLRVRASAKRLSRIVGDMAKVAGHLAPRLH